MRLMILTGLLLLTSCATEVRMKQCDTNFLDRGWQAAHREAGEEIECVAFYRDGTFHHWTEDDGYYMNWKCKSDNSLSIDPWAKFWADRLGEDRYHFEGHVTIDEDKLFKNYDEVLVPCELYKYILVEE